MNRIYKHVWSVTRGAWVVVAEIAKGQCGKKSARRRLAAAIAATAALTSVAHAEDALPTGGQVVAGAAAIASADGAMTIVQSTDRLIANWQSFSIGAGNTVTFDQPGAASVALNRVLGQDVSQIHGQLDATGQVFLVNPNGVVVGKNAQVQGGAFVAATLDIQDADFLAGRYDFAGSGGAILNQGELSGTVVALIAPIVENDGTIRGDAALAAGTNVALDFDGDGLLAVAVRASTLATLVDNRGVIHTDGGTAILTAQGASAALAGAVNNSGVVTANSLSRQGGRILLEANNGLASVSGTLDASSAGDRGGRIVATGERVAIQSGARLDARGAAGGGEIYVGGGWQGQDSTIRQAVGTVIAAGATLDASATDRGAGGTVVAWSDVHNPDSVTRAHGMLLARGGANGGDGGRIETSGHWLSTAGVQGDAAAFAGKAGEWLFDPYNVTIVAGSSSDGSFSVGDPNTWTPSADDSTILNTDINSRLDAGTNVRITTGTTGTQIGDINVSAPITKSAGGAVTLTLQAANSISVNQAITSVSGALNVVLDADNNNGTADGAGVITLYADIATNGGNLSFGTGRTTTIGGASTLVGGDVFAGGSGARTLATSGGSIDVRGELIVANNNGLTLASGGGNIRFWGLVNSGNSYSYVDGPDAQSDSWSWARTDARNGTAGGAAVGDSYLVNITSRLENAVAVATAGYRGSWIGAYRPDWASRNWFWADGPEGGAHFFTQNNPSSGSPTTGYYSNFGAGEPNGCATSAACETVGQFFGTQGQWNDLGASTAFSATQLNQYAVLGYVRETNLAPSPLTINAGSGNVTFSGAVGASKQLAALDVSGGTITVGNGARAAGTITMDALTGDLSIAGAFTSSDTTTAAIVLNAGRNAAAGTAAGGNLLVGGGTSFSVGSGGRVTLYTGSVGGSTGLAALVGAGSGRFRYNSDETVANYTAALGSGVYAVFREQPLVTVTANETITYGQTPGLAWSASGLQNGDTTGQAFTSGPSVAVDGNATSSSAGYYTAGAHTIDVTGSVTGTLGYGFSTLAGTLTVNPATIASIGGIAALDRTYDGTIGAELDASGAAFSGAVAGDVLSVVGGSGAFADKHVGVGKSVGITGLTLGGTDAANYVLADTTAAASASIGAAALTVSTADVTKTYDGTLAAAGTAIVTHGQLFDTDTLAGGSFAFTDKNAGTDKTVSVSGVTVNDGNGGGNYTVAYADNVSSTIDRATIAAVTGITAANRTYNGTTTATLDTTSAGFTGLLTGDSLAVANARGAFADPLPGTGKSVSITDLALGGADAGNYVLAIAAATATADIGAAPLEPLAPMSTLTSASRGSEQAAGPLAAETHGANASPAPLIAATSERNDSARGARADRGADPTLIAMDGVRHSSSTAALVLYRLSEDGVLTVDLPDNLPWTEAELKRLASEKLNVEAARIRSVRINRIPAA